MHAQTPKRSCAGFRFPTGLLTRCMPAAVLMPREGVDAGGRREVPHAPCAVSTACDRQAPLRINIRTIHLRSTPALGLGLAFRVVQCEACECGSAPPHQHPHNSPAQHTRFHVWSEVRERGSVLARNWTGASTARGIEPLPCTRRDACNLSSHRLHDTDDCQILPQPWSSIALQMFHRIE